MTHWSFDGFLQQEEPGGLYIIFSSFTTKTLNVSGWGVGGGGGGRVMCRVPVSVINRIRRAASKQTAANFLVFQLFWFYLGLSDPTVHMCVQVMDLVYWRDVRKTGVVFTGLVIALASVFQLSFITVFSHICLAAMCLTFPLRLYYKLLELLRWNPGVHPYQWVCQCQLTVDWAKLKNKLNDAALREPHQNFTPVPKYTKNKWVISVLCSQVVSGLWQLSDWQGDSDAGGGGGSPHHFCRHRAQAADVYWQYSWLH